MFRVLVPVGVEFIAALGRLWVLLDYHDLAILLRHCVNRAGRLLTVQDLVSLNFRLLVLPLVASIKSSLAASLAHQRQRLTKISRLGTLVDILVNWL